MKTRNTRILTVAILAGCLALGATRAEAIIINDRPIGFTLGQTLRSTSLNL